jgi:hypothetical protein
MTVGVETNSFKLVPTSYSSDDVTVLLKDLSSVMREIGTNEREDLIQKGTHYSEMLPAESEPSEAYSKLYDEAIERNKSKVGLHVATLAKRIKAQGIEKPIIVSLARAGIPVGILLKRYFKDVEHTDCSHYTISIVRDRGIDVNAMNYIYDCECASDNRLANNICFVDGWTGKGVILSQLKEAVSELKASYGDKWEWLRDDLYVLADPANVTKYCGTREDYLLPSACLNSTVSGLLSRTILNSSIKVENGEFHGAVYFKKFEEIDRSNEFINTISKKLDAYKKIMVPEEASFGALNGMNIVNKICEVYDVADYKKVKPGIGETTRVLLRRVPWKVLINTAVDKNDPDIAHILLLCEQKNIPIEEFDLGNYKVCGIIKELADA